MILHDWDDRYLKKLETFECSVIEKNLKLKDLWTAYEMNE